MSTTTARELLQEARACIACLHEADSFFGNKYGAPETIERIDAFLAQPKPELVWAVVDHSSGEIWYTSALLDAASRRSAEEGDDSIIPLYAAPIAQPEPKPSELVKLARERIDDSQRTHWEGCERDHRECLIQRMADELERLTRELDGARRTAEYWKAEHREANAAIDAAKGKA